jgi:intracellular septation protein
MKLLFDFLPLILFFATFKYGEGHKDWAAAFSNLHFSALTSGGVVAPDQAPMLLATLATIAATLAVVAGQKLRGRKVDLMLWITLVIVVVLGGLTVWLHDDTFIKWKPSGVYWSLGLIYWASETFFDRNILQATLGEQLPLPDAVWHRLNLAWVAFFLFLGLMNIVIAYSVDTPTWVNFKVFGTTALSLLFIVGQGFYINRVAPPHESAPSGEPAVTTDRNPST